MVERARSLDGPKRSPLIFRNVNLSLATTGKPTISVPIDPTTAPATPHVSKLITGKKVAMFAGNS